VQPWFPVQRRMADFAGREVPLGLPRSIPAGGHTSMRALVDVGCSSSRREPHLDNILRPTAAIFPVRTSCPFPPYFMCFCLLPTYVGFYRSPNDGGFWYGRFIDHLPFRLCWLPINNGNSFFTPPRSMASAATTDLGKTWFETNQGTQNCLGGTPGISVRIGQTTRCSTAARTLVPSFP